MKYLFLNWFEEMNTPTVSPTKYTYLRAVSACLQLRTAEILHVYNWIL
jgi:hypothetical protein